MINYKKVADRYGETLEQPECRPTVEQSVLSWALVNELYKASYPHNFQRERQDLRDFCYQMSVLKDYAARIIEMDRPKGVWIPDDYAYYHCSECGYEQDERETVTPYCPNCGARMEKDEDE